MKFPLWQSVVLVGVSLCASCGLHAYSLSEGVPAASSSEGLGAPPADEAKPAAAAAQEVAIPGPLRSFLRMAGISQKVSQEEVLPLLARNISAEGYEGSRPTEFLILLRRYVDQARELAELAGPSRVIRVANCQDATPLLRILGYRLRQVCGDKNTSLVTANPEKAFLTIDSGFPLPELEEALQHDSPFTYDFSASRVPVLFAEHDWMTASKEADKDSKDLLETLLRDPALSRLYWAMFRSDAETRAFLRDSIGLKKLVPSAGILDFYGSHISIRSGHVVVPGGAAAEPTWKDLAGANPENAGEFVPRLLTKDKGWLAAYFDAFSRINQSQQKHFTETHRLKLFYEAFRAPDPSVSAARGAFRPAPGLLLLLTQIQWDPNGEPHVPGNLEAWNQIFGQKNESKMVHAWGKRSNGWQRPDQLAEAMFALSRTETEAGALQAYLFLSQLDSRRAAGRKLSPQTVVLLSSKFADFSNQYLIFSEFPDLSDDSITHFLSVADNLSKISNHTLRGNAMGTFQANIGLWQILARQGQIASDTRNDSWESVIKPFAKISSAPQLFDAGRDSIGEVLRAATGKPGGSQNEIIDLLAGPRQETPEGQRTHQEVANKMRSVLDGQRLVSLDTLLALGDGLNQMARGAAIGDRLVPLAGELREFEMPRAIFTGSERTEWAAGTYNNRHTELQMRTDLGDVLKSPHSPGQLEEARGQLAPFLRDTLVGLNYAYYEPPGAQVLHNNPLFVRSHDFSGDTVLGVERLWQAPQLFGAGSPAGGGAHLIGSLADLPYVLSEVEQDFIAPENVQALIWRELVPGLLTNAILPRWWNVSQNELHGVALYQQAGEELLAASAGNEKLRGKVMNILSERIIPQRLAWMDQAVRDGRLAEMLPRVTPADTFYLTAEFRRRFSGENDSWGPGGQELVNLSAQYPAELSWERLSQDFGVPHPILAQSYARELLNVKPFPAFSGYSSRLLAESWDSSNLYWARLADEMGYQPVQLNRLVPELTRRMVANIFATEVEDWPAILRAMRETGEEFRQGKIALLRANSVTSRP
jgi:hypothetical protein